MANEIKSFFKKGGMFLFLEDRLFKGGVDMEKIKNFLKKESFYVVLSVCLIVLATVAVLTGDKKAEEKINKPVADATEKKEVPTANKPIEDAELVKEDKPTVVKEKDDSVATNAKPKSEIINPIKDGAITRKYNIAPRVEKDGKSANVYKGVDIEAAKGAEVIAVADGEVIEAQSGDSREGNYIKVKHSNGLTIMYGNLDAKFKVKKGDKVSQSTVLGNIGASIKVNPTDRVSKDYLLLHVEKENSPVDPLTIFKDITVKK